MNFYKQNTSMLPDEEAEYYHQHPEAPSCPVQSLFHKGNYYPDF